MTIIKIENLTKKFGDGPTAVIALDHISVSVNAGEIVAVMGPSGCGKSTLLHLVGRLDKPTNGKIILEDLNIADISDARLTELRRRRIGFVFQFFNLLPTLTAVENVALPLVLDGVKTAKANSQAVEWLKKVGLSDRLNYRPDQLSGGQQQRVAIARALVAEPALILADEPTGNLDSRSSDEVASLLRTVSEKWGRTVLMVTHDPRIAAYADRIIFLKDGHIVEETKLSGTSAQKVKRVRQKAKAL
jgi:putative ABC transport system ATP-binding protein